MTGAEEGWQKQLCQNEEEVKHVKKVLTVNGYKKWSFKIPRKKVRGETNATEGPTSNKHPCASLSSPGYQNNYRGHLDLTAYPPTTNLLTPQGHCW